MSDVKGLQTGKFLEDIFMKFGQKVRDDLKEIKLSASWRESLYYKQRLITYI